VVDCIADAQRFADLVIGQAPEIQIPPEAEIIPEDAIAKKGILREAADTQAERCLDCHVVCQICADVCPNRANVVIHLPDGRPQILHVDRMCNECGNCTAFCPYDSAPYKEKFTLFQTLACFEESTQSGFLPLEDSRILVRLNGQILTLDLQDLHTLPADISLMIQTIVTQYPYLLG